jgi:putative transport protein
MTGHPRAARPPTAFGHVGTSPGLAAVQEAAKSKVPTLGYGVTYAVGNVFLALWGSVMVALMIR